MTSRNPMNEAVRAITDALLQDKLDPAIINSTVDRLYKIFEGRKWCLELASRGSGMATSTHVAATDLVNAAKIFEAYLDGKEDAS